jgi:membrane fusion protein, multidrug efflux system
MIGKRWCKTSLAGLIGTAVTWNLALAQTPQAPAAADSKATAPVAVAGDQVVVKRESPRILPPQEYRVSLVLEPYTLVTLTAPHDGLVRQIAAKSGQKLIAQAELLRFDNTEARFRLQRAAALHKAATLEQKLAAKDASQDELAKARVEAAKADLDLAQYHLDQTAVRAPLAGEVLRVLVSEGEYVRAGEPLIQFGDLTRMKVEIPVSRSEVQVDQTLAVNVDSAEVEAKVEAILPLAPRFDPLRDLFDSIASAVIVIDNPGGKLQPGQSVFVPMIPRQPIVQVASSAVGNLPDGQRKVQVIRASTVRDVPVQLLGGQGPTRTFVSGPFLEGDEVIYESSHLLADGFQLKSASLSSATGNGPATAPGAPPTPSNPARNKAGF